MNVTDQHVSNQVSWSSPDYHANEHASKNGEYRLMDRANPFYLDIVRCPKGEDQEYAKNRQSPRPKVSAKGMVSAAVG
jgi:hypothetical protein